MRRILVALVCALGAIGVADARADTPPTRWQRAASAGSGSDMTGVGATYRLHEVVQARLAGTGRIERGIDGQIDLETVEARFLGALALLERARAAESPDVRLRFDLGYIYEKLGELTSPHYYRLSADVLKKALAIAPDHPAAESSWLILAYACGHFADHECERNAYTHVLRVETEDMERGTAVLNLAETEMHIGNLKEAVEGYREALRLAGRFPSGNLAALAVWGLAVALDRSGDSIGAEKEARFALEIERSMNRPPAAPPILRSAGVFFAPAYEIDWYEGLTLSAQARVEVNPARAASLWRRAERSWSNFVKLADHNDRWLELAKVRFANAKAAREAAEKLEKKRPKPKTPDVDEPEDTTL